jgi:tetratricopeptide (TPR) repeat protein
MKRYIKSIMTLGIFSLALVNTSCVEETEPADGIATEAQVGESSSATEALVMAIPAYCHTIMWEDYHDNFGYGSFMHIRDLQTGDGVMEFSADGYDYWFYQWTRNKNMGQDYFWAQYQWIYHWRFMQAVNNVINSINAESATAEQKGWLGSALAYRALLYLDLARMYEFLPNDKTSNINEDGNDVAGLTVPIVKEGISESDARNNPRVSHAAMSEFIESDLKRAEELVVNLTDTRGNILPDLGVVYGLFARLYMWDENYAKAQEYARKAIDTTPSDPMTQQECLNTTTGFNVADPWMLAAQQTSTTRTVTTGIINWTSWVSNQQNSGYSGLGKVYFKIDKRFYERISDTDFRKLEFKAPEGSPLADLVSYVTTAHKTNLPEYASVKFRPGNGNATSHIEGCAVAYPLMRVEEMYFIEAEAAAHQSAAQGKQLVEAFMKQYRDPQYSCNVSSTDDVVEEIVFQKRVELWGEGQSFFDIKRLNYSVTRGYTGTNVTDELARLNTNGRPAWMNWVITQAEYESNEALVGMNNPDPTDKYTPWVETK